ncbi:hypothetical protein EDD18DRAFT_1072869, partial [Armillaria luteobubalina]
AVVIGIDAYEAQNTLHGCVSDATNFRRYMRENLGVPPDHIKLLLGIDNTTPPKSLRPGMSNISATRANIVDALLDLSTNPQIRHGDNIVIYFSRTWHILSMQPCALWTVTSSQTPGDAVKPVIPDISDREVSTILTEICRTKGHHITVILDCCFSSGTTRNPMKGEGSTTHGQGAGCSKPDPHCRDVCRCRDEIE